VRPRPPRFCARKVSSEVRLMKPSRVMVTTIWPGSIRLRRPGRRPSAMSVIRGEAILRGRDQFLAHHLHAARRADDVQQVPICSATSVSSAWILSRSRPVRRCRRSSRMPRACSSVSARCRRRMMLPGIVDQRQQRRRRPRPASRGPSAPRAPCGIRAGADHPDHLIDIGDRDGQADQQMRPVARLVRDRSARAGDHFLAEFDEALQRSFSPICAAGLCPAPAC
jgi:hypothetical protein